MTDDRMALMGALQKADDGNFVRSLADTVPRILMEADVEGMIGAGRYERNGELSIWRDGYRDRTLDCPAASQPVSVKAPRARQLDQALVSAHPIKARGIGRRSSSPDT